MFVELTPAVLVDPTEVAAVTENPDGGSRIYMRGSGARSHLMVDLSVAEVSSALAHRLPNHILGAAPSLSLRDELTRSRKAPRPGPRREF